jgi:hypothetical protein
MERENRGRRTQLRLELRQIEVEIRAIRREQQAYRRLGFDQELMENHIFDLQLQQQEYKQRLAHLDLRASRGGEARLTWTSRLLMAPYVALCGLQSIAGGLSRALSEVA